MSGHSKWATIKRQKGANDAARGKVFSKLARTIAIAARDGADPEFNFKLRIQVEKARQVNMPKDNIARAIRKGSGQEKGEVWEEITYEGFGPVGVAVMVEAVTDNKNRTTSEVKNIFEKAGGSLATPGAVAFQFKKAGVLRVKKTTKEDDQVLTLMDLAVDDVEVVDDCLEVVTAPQKLNEIKQEIEKGGMEIQDAELVWKPTTQVNIDDAQVAARVVKFMEVLEEHDDVQKVYANFEMPMELLNSVSA